MQGWLLMHSVCEFDSLQRQNGGHSGIVLSRLLSRTPFPYLSVVEKMSRSGPSGPFEIRPDIVRTRFGSYETPVLAYKAVPGPVYVESVCETFTHPSSIMTLLVRQYSLADTSTTSVVVSQRQMQHKKSCFLGLPARTGTPTCPPSWADPNPIGLSHWIQS